MNRPVPRPEPLEALTCLLLGEDSNVPPLPEATGSFHEALEQVLIRALERPPCVVSFSGGRDSSAVLAATTSVARKHGLPLPIPVTMRFPESRVSDETDWQLLVLDHLKLANCEVLELADELDLLGEVATGTLRRHGLLWPANTYMHMPVIDLAAGGTLLTGAGGDELFSTSSPRRRPRQLLLAALPARLRAEVRRRRWHPDGYGWLTAEGFDAVHRALVDEEIRWPYAWDRALYCWYKTRAFAAVSGAIGLIAQHRDVRVTSPLVDPQTLAELAAIGGSRGFPTRTEAMHRLFGSLLPDPVLGRATKATFGPPIWGPTTRGFIAGWSGAGVDERCVDLSKLRAELDGPDPDARTLPLVQQAWLHEASLSTSSSSEVS